LNQPPFVTEIPTELTAKFKTDLEEQGFEFSSAPYALFSAKKKGINLTLYTSLKLVVQGKEKEEFIAYYLEPEILKSFHHTNKLAYMDQTARIGIDEAGKGDFFGPLCVAGVYADSQAIEKLVKWGVVDSKTLSDQKIQKMAQEIKKELIHTVIQLFPEKYNELYPKFGNLNRMLAWGHATCIETLMRQTGCNVVTIDQFASEYVVESALKKKNLQPELTQKHQGESDIVVAAASILARNGFLEGMKKLGDRFHTVLPKGASALVKTAGKKLFLEYGEEGLYCLVKTHFKTYEEVIHD
jgi:ribonuclease HIII